MLNGSSFLPPLSSSVFKKQEQTPIVPDPCVLEKFHYLDVDIKV
jgi:hypothetical protein